MSTNICTITTTMCQKCHLMECLQKRQEAFLSKKKDGIIWMKRTKKKLNTLYCISRCIFWETEKQKFGNGWDKTTKLPRQTGTYSLYLGFFSRQSEAPNSNFIFFSFHTTQLATIYIEHELKGKQMCFSRFLCKKRNKIGHCSKAGILCSTEIFFFEK